MSYTPKYEMNEKIRVSLREIEKMKDRVRGRRILPAAEASIRLRASVEAVHSSTSIEGNPLSVSEVRRIVTADKGAMQGEAASDTVPVDGKNAAPRKNLTREEYAEIEVRNYKRALDYIDKRRHGEAEVTLADVLELHRIITDGLLDESRNGKIRQNPVYIENQEHEVLYTAARADEVQAELTALLEWVDESQFVVHPVVIAAILHFRLVAIHPFADGNGRTARAATALFLALNQYDCGGALELDSFYAADRQAYYAVLQLVNGRDYESSQRADLTPWIEYFAEGFLTSLHVLDAEIRIINLVLPEGGGAGSELELSAIGAANALGVAEQEILSYVEKCGSIGIADAERLLPEVGRRSLQRKLKRLVDEGWLAKTGEGREVRYGRGE